MVPTNSNALCDANPVLSVFALFGDGAFHYKAVPSCLGGAEEHGLPTHVVVFNNGRSRSMETSLTKYFPDGAAKNTGVHPRRQDRPSPRLPILRQSPRRLRLPRRPAERELTEIDVVLSDCNPWQIFCPRIEL